MNILSIQNSFERVLYGKLKKKVSAISDGFIMHIYKGKLKKKTKNQGSDISVSMKEAIKHISKREKDGVYVSFAVSREYLEQILKIGTDHFVISVPSDIDTDIDTTSERNNNALIIRYDDLDCMSILMPCYLGKMNTWTPVLGVNDEIND